MSKSKDAVDEMRKLIDSDKCLHDLCRFLRDKRLAFWRERNKDPLKNDVIEYLKELPLEMMFPSKQNVEWEAINGYGTLKTFEAESES